ncbi:PREDICTED: complement component C8 gamma chain isoform X2 [Miniopterus natalensis]|uniref:complement component C8 gamma chain isoform X2 n=1 Tax=Miniopterus natalensis TaxID=291302 RepID=UPI0007A6BD0C|nr:PREDICTED: complement component C8 gamma chain isoform X2 [Miniopterus natalensis]
MEINVQRAEHWPPWKSGGGFWTNSQKSTQTLYIGHGARTLPGSAGSRSDVQGQAKFMRRLGGQGARPGLEFGENRQWTSWARLLGVTGQWTLTQNVAILPLVLLSPVTRSPAMLSPRTALLLTLLLAAGFLGLRARKPPKRPSLISTIQPKADFDSLQFAGSWFLVAVASSCPFLQEQGHQAQATALKVAPQGTAMVVNTFQKLDGICWQVRQLYGDTEVPGRFLLQARGAKGEVQVAVGETDYQNFAILYLEQGRRLSVKLYARSLPVNDLAVSKFEQSVQRAGLTEDHILYFPKYGFCEDADQFHILDEIRR